MRVALGVLFLILLFCAAALIQERWLKGVDETLPGIRVQPEVQLAEVPREEFPAEEGWARLVIGRPSGVDAVELPFEVELRETYEPHVDEPVVAEDEPLARPADYEITLDENSTLSELCVRFYGTGAPKVYEQLAQYNGLPNANAIRAGQKLRVPPTRELLFAE